MSGRNVPVCVHALQSLNQSLFECVDHYRRLACARLGGTCRLPFAHYPANNPECAWVQATARGFWVRLLVSPAFVERPGQLATCNGQVREARAARLSARRSRDDRAPSRSGRAMSAPNRASGALLAIASGSIGTRAFDAHNREGKFRADTLHRPGTFSSPVRFLPMMDTFTMLSFIVTFLAGASAGAWLV